MTSGNLKIGRYSEGEIGGSKRGFTNLYKINNLWSKLISKHILVSKLISYARLETNSTVHKIHVQKAHGMDSDKGLYFTNKLSHSTK